LDEFANENLANQRKIDLLKKLTKSLIHYQGVADISSRLNTNCKDIYSYISPIIDMDVYLKWLLRMLEKLGAVTYKKRISLNLTENQDAILREFQADLIINCSGLGAKELASDETMFPVRGALIRCFNEDSESFNKYTEAHCTSVETMASINKFIYILPRGENTLLLGGLAEVGESSTDVQFEDALVQEMYQNCLEFDGGLRDAKMCPQKIIVGLRPYRKNSVRVERENTSKIIHNYGHAGSGVLLSWGCARSIYKIIESYV
jgi:D-amino-acid oxidase